MELLPNDMIVMLSKEKVNKLFDKVKFLFDKSN